jgi:DNA mismatch endonuclease (patch repair protein)
MAQVRSQRNRSTEWRLRSALVRAGIRDWTLNPADVEGKPDFVFPALRMAVFVDGCFWHGCPKCLRLPSSNVSYWERKIEKNRIRDKRVSATLRRRGWSVMRIWECELTKLNSVVAKIQRRLSRRSA